MNENLSDELKIKKLKDNDKIIALGGNPNVGKSTLFNRITGMNQHTGNWPGKTVETANGRYRFGEKEYILVDLPGTYSLLANSAEEEVASDFLVFSGADAQAIVCDATCLERNLNLVLQATEITPNTIVCVNLLDEAKRKNIEIDFSALEKELGLPIVPMSARRGVGTDEFYRQIERACENPRTQKIKIVSYPIPIERAIENMLAALPPRAENRHLAIRLLTSDKEYLNTVKALHGLSDDEAVQIENQLACEHQRLSDMGMPKDILKDKISACLVMTAENIAARCVVAEESKALKRDRKLDRILTGKLTGIPIMLLLLCGVLWLTIQGANYPSALLSDGLFWVENHIKAFFVFVAAPAWLTGILVDGIYHTLAWVVSVMLPPMAIFFPLFTLLEDFGYLPRVAFNLDNSFKKARSCGKQALTMCMGFGCNAAGVVGCRIIDSPRERLIAILTNAFVPCNGRFPTIIAIISMFFIGASVSFGSSLLSAVLLTAAILLGVFLTFAVSRLLSSTLLKGVPSSFALELPPYRKPQIGKVIVRSLLDRTLLVLGRAACVAAPAGAVIWLMANITFADISILTYVSEFLDPFARILGLDGVILLAFILGLPANEIVIPLIIMAYSQSGVMADYESLASLKALLVDNGWTTVTAISTMIFCISHWPCSTTCLSIKKETGSFKWTAVGFLLPTAIGMAFCFIFTTIARFCGIS